MNFLLQYWDVIAFYSLVAILLYTFRSRFEFQGIVALLKTKLGLDFMTRAGKRHPKFWHHLGLLSIILGFVGMAFITVYVFYGIYQTFFIPEAPPVLSPVIPGVKIPGVPITFPLWYTLFGLFLSVVIHEAAHGIWSAAYNIKIKSSGFAFFGPLPGAFVEPDEATMVKRPRRQQLAIMAAGPFANMILAALAFGVAALLGFAALGMVNLEGVTVGSVQEGYPAAAAGIPPGALITAVGETPIHTSIDLTKALGAHKPGDTVVIFADGAQYGVTLAAHPDDATRGYLGVVNSETKIMEKHAGLHWLYEIVLIAGDAFTWTFIISLGLGTANLLPIGPIDGGRMLLLALETRYDAKRAKQIWVRWSFALLGIVLVLVFVPIIKAIVA